MPTQSNKKLISTTGPSYYGIGLKSAKKALVLSFFETTAKISIHSTLPDNMRTGNQVYDYKSGVEIYLKPKASKNLSKILRKAINYISEGNDFTPMAVSSGVELIEVSDGTKFNLPTSGVTIAIYSDINEEKKSNKCEVFQFYPDTILKNYDGATGTYESDNIITDPEMLMEALNDFARESSCASAHVMKREFSYDMNQIIARQLSVMDKLGISNPYNKSSEGGYGSGYGLNKNNSNGWNNNYSSNKVSAKSYSSTDDVISDIGDMM